MLESNFAPKGSPAARLCQIFILLCFRVSSFAYAYRTCKDPYAYAYACVVRVNQALALYTGADVAFFESGGRTRILISAR